MTGKRRSNYKGERATLHLKLPTDLHQRLAAVAEERDVSVNFLIQRAVTAYLDKLKPLDEAL